MPKHYRKKKSLAMKAYKIAKSLQNAQEKKFFDNVTLIGNIDWNGFGPTALIEPDQGINDNQRVGDSIFCTSLRFRLIADRNGSDCTGIRIIVIWDKKNTIGGIGDLLLTGSPNALTSDYFVDNRADYNVLVDKTFNVDGVIAERKTAFFRRKIKKSTQYLNGGLVIEKGAIKAYYISDENNLSVAKPLIRVNYRVYYTDS